MGFNTHHRRGYYPHIIMKLVVIRHMAELRSLDLFTGIGGFARGLHGIARPVAMCDLDADAREVLRCRMSERRLPLCPVFDDVRALKASDLPQSVDLVVGGWPCQDLSCVGLRRGLGGTRSGLVSEVFRLIDETGAKGAILENVPQLLSAGFSEVLNAFVSERGFDVSWCVLPACAVGAPHIRKRLFMWVRKPTFEYEWPAWLESPEWPAWPESPEWPAWPESPEWPAWHEYKPHDWSQEAEPPRMAEVAHGAGGASRDHRNKRQMLLGNSVVPDCLRAAFMVLASGFRKAPRPDALSLRIETPSMAILKVFDCKFEDEAEKQQRQQSLFPKWGYARQGADGTLETYAVLPKHVPVIKLPALDMALVPDAYKWVGSLQKPRPGVERSPLIKEPVPMTAWSTPRSVTCAANSLTKRVARDLPTQVRYERGTPDELRGGQINTAFVEWLMAYPEDWTRLPASWKTTSPIGYRPNGRKPRAKVVKTD